MLKFFGYFTDGAILQRGEEICVEGYADAPAACTLSCDGVRITRPIELRADGTFVAVLPPVTDTKREYTLALAGERERASVRVRFGDVYLAMGQSNMSYSLGSVEESERWKKRAQAVPVSVLDLYEKACARAEEVTRPVTPLRDFALPYVWTDGKEDAIGRISAIGVQTAVLLAERERVPVGMVHTAMGGLSVEAYLPRETLEADEETLAFTKRAGRYQSVADYNKAGGRNYTQLAGVWNEKIAPLVGRKFKGIIWYLGESSAWDFEFAQFFFKEMKMAVSALREAFGLLPFIAVQIAPEYYPYGDRFGYEYINEALTRLQDEERDVYTIPIYDIEPRWNRADGERYYHPIHPVNKAPVSRRIADALSKRRTRFPQITNVLYRENRAVCTVEYCKELVSKGEIFGFTLCGEDGKYYPAAAKIAEGNKIEVTSPDVKRAAGLTFAFMQYQEHCNLTDGDGAPLMPYRSHCEPVDGRYYFPPAFTKNGALFAYENNFGIQAGNCHKVPVWTSGNIYRAGSSIVRAGEGEIVVEAKPTAKDFFLFGVSPAICLCGHKNHLADFEYLNFELCAEGDTEFLGMVVRRADGEIFRFELLNGETAVDFLPVLGQYHRYTVRLSRGVRGDGAPLSFAKGERQFVQAELLFRSERPVKVRLKNLIFSDASVSVGIKHSKNRDDAPTRADIALPQATDRTE